MKTYAVCDQDGFVTLSAEGDIAHYASNPTHTSHIGVGGDSSSPVPYSGSSGISQVDTDPVSPTAGQTWVLRSVATAVGVPIGLLLSLTYAANSYTYQLSYFTNESTIVRTALS